MSQLRDRIASMVFAFDDADRQDAVRALARDVGAMEARVAELERDLEQAKADRNRAAMDARNPLLARVAELEAENKHLTQLLDGYRVHADAHRALLAKYDAERNGWLDVVGKASRAIDLFAKLEARCKRLEEAGDALQSAVVGTEGMTHWQWLAAAHEADLKWRKAKEAKP